MSFFQKQEFCPTCRRKTLFLKANPEQNKTIAAGMALLTVLTCGLFLPVALVWGVMHGWEIGSQTYRCQTCGSTVKTGSGSGLVFGACAMFGVVLAGLALVANFSGKTTPRAPSTGEAAPHRVERAAGIQSTTELHVAREVAPRVSDRPTVAERSERVEERSLADLVEPKKAHGALPRAELRTWSSASGKFSTEATFMNAGGGKVKLRKSDGTEVSVPLEQLSDEDRQWIKERGQRAR